jgi:Lipase (class 3)
MYAYYAKAQDTLLKDRKIIANEKWDTQAVLGYDPEMNMIITSYRGSCTIKNFLEDGHQDLVAYEAAGCTDCHVEQGFFFAYNTISKEVNSYVKTLHAKYPNAEVIVTGHSLGASQALYGAVDQILMGLPVNVYTYGCPRSGDENFTNFFSSIVPGANMRAAFRDDPVPAIPSQVDGFFHTGTEVHFYDCENFVIYPAETDDWQDRKIIRVGDHGGYICLTPTQAHANSQVILQ